MIISKTPLRISLGGGGTDLPSYYQNSGGGFLIAAAINKHIYVNAHDNFENTYLLKYSQIENVIDTKEIQHPIIREALKLLGTRPGIEISSQADIPAGTGLGSSGTFTVGLLKSLHAYHGIEISNLEIAELACQIEIYTLGNPVGKQDQYIAAFGGVSSFEFNSDGTVNCKRLDLTMETVSKLQNNLQLFFTGYKRSATQELSALEISERVLSPSIRANLDSVKKIGIDAHNSLLEGDLKSFSKMLTDQWELKLSRSSSELNMRIDSWIRVGLQAGALGGKLVGAGGGGFLLFYAEDKESLRNAMSRLGLREIQFDIDFLGSTLI
jgi:D-glycero-alpha-D-manno-heptose-7-phosphate kinase